MKLEELLSFEDIVIQGHDNPDADCIAAGWAVLRYLESHGKKARLIYGGRRAVTKANLLLMVEALAIPLEHVESLPAPPELLVTVDCQYGERNVQRFDAGTVAVIDHHKPTLETLPPLREVRSAFGACATVVWDLLREAGMDAREDEALATALYYGLYMDTGRLQELRHPLDRDMQEALEFACSRSRLTRFQNCNLSAQELTLAGDALRSCHFDGSHRFAVVEADRCDPNILGVISDMLIEVDTVDACAAFCMLEDGAKLSVRSCVQETRADELAAYLAEGLGSGGGHGGKAGGFLKLDLLEKLNVSDGAAVLDLLRERLERYFRDQVFIHAGSEDVPDLSGERLYRKKRLPIGYVRAANLYRPGTKVLLRELEGDQTVTIREDTYLIIGAEGEVYLNDEAYFRAHNDPIDQPYVFHGEYAPTLREAVTALDPDRTPPRQLTDCVRAAIPRPGSLVRARKLDRRTKVLRPDSEGCLLGLPGDYLAAREEDPADVYIIRRKILDLSYEQV